MTPEQQETQRRVLEPLTRHGFMVHVEPYPQALHAVGPNYVGTVALVVIVGLDGLPFQRLLLPDGTLI